MDKIDYPSFVANVRGRPTAAIVQAGRHADSPEADPFPDWFTAFLHDRQTRKPSAHTMKAYRQDFLATAGLVTDGDPTHMDVVDITRDSMRAAFAAYAHDHEVASIRWCWSTWNVLCTLLYTGEQLAANPMQLCDNIAHRSPSIEKSAVH
jgi:site-specific recombinase XerC